MNTKKISGRFLKFINNLNSFNKNIGFYQILKNAPYFLPKKKKQIIPVNNEILLLTLPSINKLEIPLTPPLGISLIKAYIGKLGIDSTCFDLELEYFYHIKNKHAKKSETSINDVNQFFDQWIASNISKSTKIIGISLTSLLTIPSMKLFSSKMKIKYPKILLIAGGPPISDSHEKILSDNSADVVVIGAGEKIFYDIVANHLKGKLDLSTKKYENNDSPNMSTTPDFSDFKISSYKKTYLYNTLPIIMSSGCKGACTFCIIKHYKKKSANKTGLNMYKEMIILKKKYKIFKFNFVESMINFNLIELEHLCDYIINDKELLLWTANFSIWNQPSTRLIEKMAKAGCFSVNIGIETGSEKIRKDMCKYISDDKIDGYLNLFAKNFINVTINIIVGYPTETEKEFQKTLRFIKKYHKLIDKIAVNKCQILKGTRLFENSNRIGIIFDENGEWATKYSNPDCRSKRLAKTLLLINKTGINR